MTKLSVNINKVATLRNARGGNNPDVEKVALDCEAFGAEGITVHPRPDERHIRYADVLALRPILRTEFNIEGYPSKEFIDLVLKVKPHQVTLVPDAPDQITSNSGWDTKNNLSFLEENKTFGLIGIVLLILISLLMQALSFIKLSQSTIILMTVLVFVLSLLFLFLFFQYRQNYLEKEKLKIQRENNDRINHIYDSLLKKEHRMLYVLRKLDHVISDEETHQFIEKEIDDLMHKQFVSHTNNPIFDHRLTILMQSLEDYDIKMIVMIPVDARLDDANIIEQMEIFIREHVTDHTEIRLKVKDNQFIINCNDKTKSIRLKTPH